MPYLQFLFQFQEFYYSPLKMSSFESKTRREFWREKSIFLFSFQGKVKIKKTFSPTH